MRKTTYLLFCVAVLGLMAGTVAAAESKAAAKAEAATLENLQEAYNGESNAKIRYEAFAAKAETEGYLGVAGLFKAAALSGGIHAARYAKAIEAAGGTPKAEPSAAPVVKSTRENIKEAIKGEHESKKMYPAFMKKAEADKNQQAMYGFKGAIAAEKVQLQMYTQALANLKDWKVKKKFIVCRNCGYTTMDLKLKTCPVCSQPREQFTEVE